MQFVYFGGLFQRVSSFHFGALVFGSMIVLFVGGTAIRDPQVLRNAWNNPRPVIAVNLCVLFALGAYLLSVQLVEPAVVYAISSATMPVTTYVLYRLGVREGEGMRNLTEGIGTFLLFVSILISGTSLCPAIPDSFVVTVRRRPSAAPVWQLSTAYCSPGFWSSRGDSTPSALARVPFWASVCRSMSWWLAC